MVSLFLVMLQKRLTIAYWPRFSLIYPKLWHFTELFLPLGLFPYLKIALLQTSEDISKSQEKLKPLFSNENLVSFSS